MPYPERFVPDNQRSGELPASTGGSMAVQHGVHIGPQPYRVVARGRPSKDQQREPSKIAGMSASGFLGVPGAHVSEDVFQARMIDVPDMWQRAELVGAIALNVLDQSGNQALGSASGRSSNRQCEGSKRPFPCLSIAALNRCRERSLVDFQLADFLSGQQRNRHADGQRQVGKSQRKNIFEFGDVEGGNNKSVICLRDDQLVLLKLAKRFSDRISADARGFCYGQLRDRGASRQPAADDIRSQLLIDSLDRITDASCTLTNHGPIASPP